MTLASRSLAASLRTTAFRSYLSLLAMVAISGFAVVMMARRRRSLFDLLAAHLHRLDIEVGPSMTMSEALHGLRMTHPAAAAELAPLIEMYEAERFSGKQERGRIGRIRRRLGEMSES